MKHSNFIIVIVTAAILAGCSQAPKGYLAGVYGKIKPETTPYGMIFVPRGAYTMGSNDQSVTWSLQSKQHVVTIEPFWMDETEITNGEYHQFVNWVRDSIALRKLSAMDDETEAAKYYHTSKVYGQEELDTTLNWKAKIPWGTKWKEDDELNEAKFNVVESMYYSGLERTEGHQLNAQILNYSYKWVDEAQGALPGNAFNPYTGSYGANAKVRIDSAFMRNGAIVDTVIIKPLRHRSDLICSKIINIYPDTMCWMREYTFSFNEPAMRNYFSHPSYGKHPVVGVSWDQARAFCHWRTNLYKSVPGLPATDNYRLPTEAEWEYAARGGRHLGIYPWGGPYIRDAKGCFMANYKPCRGNYVEDGYTYPCQVGSFDPNDFGLYDMSGNVAEWTNDTYDPTAAAFTHDMNASYYYNSKSNDTKIMKRKVIRGGSWKDIGAYLQCGARDFEYQTKRSPAIGFRCVRSYIGD